ncbi:hypothetical protein bmyco0002_59640 [Bacillus pseudomycoides]|uniref:ABC-three component system protein n=1 Tax=Bacillus pseudomycoides TaxID=64104 RepID=UPI0001A1439C|nr:ABC-three component system protein [Bacillus pseudomycoides]EEM01729.1 hypothetical protein bmyco0002_59640 [Bacillus pseudomycoides]PGC34210.1 hypothetical protein COM18_24590 [Bacillus pseudomycoides]
MATKFSAGEQAIGYLYQVRYALYLLLDDKNIDKDVAIEQLDDVHFESNGSPAELIQLKHHISQKASLTDGCADFWKTIRVWSEQIIKKEIIPEDLILTLISTSTAPDKSIASYLRGDSKRNPEEALRKMFVFMEKSKSETNKVNFEAFKKLREEDQRKLLTAILIIDNTPNILTVSELIKQKLKLVVRRPNLNALYERLEGWWFNRTIVHLASKSDELISGIEVQDVVNEIRDQLGIESLPIDYRTEIPPEIDVSNDQKIFIEQLRILSLSSKRIEHAIRDYYRAYLQRSRWVRDELLFVGELQRYEDQLLEEWERYFEMINEDEIEGSEINMRKMGKELYNKIQDLQIHIRRNCIEPYVMRGSYHILANKDNLCLGWHPQFVERIREVISTYEKVSS